MTSSGRKALVAFAWVYGVWYVGVSVPLTCVYLIAYAFAGGAGETAVAFMSRNDFAALQLAAFVVPLPIAALWAAVVWASNRRSAGERWTVVRRIDDWVEQLTRRG